MSSQPVEFADIHGANTVYDVAVVGAGVQGCSTAYHCVKQGLKTLLLEQFSLPHSRGSSHGQSRITRYSYKQTHYSQMMTEAFPMWAELEKETNTSLYRKTGLLTISLPPRKALYQDSLHQMQKHGRRYKVLDRETLERDYPELRLPKGSLVFMDYDGGTLRADKALLAFQKEFVKRGGHLREEQKVLEIIPGTIVTIRTRDKDYRARNVVLTPGAWAKQLLRPLGLDLPVEVLRINVPYWKEREKGIMNDLPNCIFELAGDDAHVYSLQSLEYPGLTKVAYHGGLNIEDPDYRDATEDKKKTDLKVLKSFVAQCFPRLESEPTILETCMYTNTPDSELIIDRHPNYPNVLVCCGCSGHGFKLSPSVGKILCRLAMGLESHIDISALSFKRFKNSCLVTNAKL